MTFVSAFKVPDVNTEASINLKKAIYFCDSKDIVKSQFVQNYVDTDWQKNARKYTFIEFFLFISFATLHMT